MKARKAPQRLVGEIQLFRIRVAAAESKLKVMREQAREAKRRRKEAKRIAQSARKRFKQSKADLSELREALAKAEAKLFQAGGRALARKAKQAKRKAQIPTRKPAVAKPKRPGRHSLASTAAAPERKLVQTAAKGRTGNRRAADAAKPADMAPTTARPRRAAALRTTVPFRPLVASPGEDALGNQPNSGATDNPALSSFPSISADESAPNATTEPI